MDVRFGPDDVWSGHGWIGERVARDSLGLLADGPGGSVLSAAISAGELDLRSLPAETRSAVQDALLAAARAWRREVLAVADHRDEYGPRLAADLGQLVARLDGIARDR